MSNSDQADSQFQKLIKIFHDAFGIQREEDVQTEQRKILSQSIRIDATVVFPEDFDFTTLRERIFPFLSLYTIFEYKGGRDPLLVGHFYLYSFAELGLMTARFLSKERTDRKAHNYLSLRAARERSQQLKEQGAMHSCCTVILSTGDPRQLRKKVGFEPVTEYSHLDGALYRLVHSENEYVGSIATYLVVLNNLPVCEINAPLLLLTTGKKKIEFCRWLQSDTPGIALEEKLDFQLYLLKNGLIQDEETEKEMRRKLITTQSDYDWLLDEFGFNWVFQRMLDAHSPQEVAQKAFGVTSAQEVAQKAFGVTSAQEVAQKAFGVTSAQEVAQKAFGVTSAQEVAQKALGATSAQEVAQKALGATSQEELAQKALHADSPVDAALKLLPTASERREFLKRWQQEESVPVE